MIGRDGPVKPFELLRWARAQAAVCELAPLEAHLLLVLATYANRDAVAWPTLRTLQADCRKGRRQVIAAMRRLEDLQLVWSEQAGRGRAARRELLFNPIQPTREVPCPASAADSAVRPTALQAVVSEHTCSAETAPSAVRPAALHGVNGHRNGQTLAAVEVEGMTNGQVTQCGPPHCSGSPPPPPETPHRHRRGLRPLADVLNDLHPPPAP